MCYSTITLTKKILFHFFFITFFACSSGHNDAASPSSNDDSYTDDSATDNTQKDDTDQDDVADFTTIYPPPNIDLYGAIWWFDGGGPHELVYQHTAVLHYSRFGWNTVAQFSDCKINGLWGSSQDDLYVVGNEFIENTWGSPTRQFMAHFDGNQWTKSRFNLPLNFLNDVHGNSKSNVYLVGDSQILGYKIYHFNGNFWHIEKHGNPYTRLDAVWVSPSDLVVAAGSLVVMKEDGAWREFTDISGMTAWISSDDTVFVAGGYYIYRYSEGVWEQLYVSYNLAITNLFGVSSTNLYALALDYNNTTDEILLHYDGTEWQSITIPINQSFTGDHWGALWVASNDSVFVSPQSFSPYGSLLYYNTNSWHLISNEYGPHKLWGFISP